MIWVVCVRDFEWLGSTSDGACWTCGKKGWQDWDRGDEKLGCMSPDSVALVLKPSRYNGRLNQVVVGVERMLYR